MARRHYYFDTMFRTLKDGLSIFLRNSGICYNLSYLGTYWHFDVLCNAGEAKLINNWLNEHTITEQR